MTWDPLEKFKDDFMGGSVLWPDRQKAEGESTKKITDGWAARGALAVLIAGVITALTRA